MPGMRRIGHTKIDPRTRRGLAMFAQNADMLFGDGLELEGNTSGISGITKLKLKLKDSGGLASDSDGLYIALDTPAHGKHLSLGSGGLSIKDDYVFNTGDVINGQLEILSTTTPQLKLSYDATYLAQLSVSSAGDLTIDATANIIVGTDLETDRWLNNDFNIFLGVDVAGAGNLAHTAGIEGWHNTALGSSALYSTTTGYANVALGSSALYSTTTGYGNMAIGTNTLYDNISGYYNVAIGQDCMYSNTTGYRNIAIGRDTLKGNVVTGHDNVAFGYRALYVTTSGYDNNAFGYYALGANTTGHNNFALGNSSLRYNTTGYENVAIGSDALLSNTSSWQNVGIGGLALASMTTHGANVGIGYQAGQYLGTGNFNVFIGYQAGRGASATSKSRNVFIGSYAGYSETGNDKLYIENSNSATPLIYGDFNTNLLRIHGDLEVSGDLIFISAGDGLCYGSLYQHETATTIDLVQNTYVKITGFTTGLLNNVSINSDAFNVDKVGVYKIDWSLSIDPASVCDIHFDLFLNGVEQPDGSARRKFGTANDHGCVAGTAILDVTDTGHDIDIRAKNITNSNDMDVYHANFNIVQIGGT